MVLRSQQTLTCWQVSCVSIFEHKLAAAAVDGFDEFLRWTVGVWVKEYRGKPYEYHHLGLSWNLRSLATNDATRILTNAVYHWVPPDNECSVE